MKEASIEAMAGQLAKWLEEGLRVFATTSLQTQSLPLLHLLHRMDPALPVYCIDTGFLFPETLAFRDELMERFGFRIRTATSTATYDERFGPDGRPLYESDPDACCARNKVDPMKPLLEAHDVWISGVRADQSRARGNLPMFAAAGHGCMRYHPLLDWTAAEVERYVERHGLPKHPLRAKGFRSIGCWPCTRPVVVGADERSGRWSGTAKTECGLHTVLVERQAKAG